MLGPAIAGRIAGRTVQKFARPARAAQTPQSRSKLLAQARPFVPLVSLSNIGRGGGGAPFNLFLSLASRVVLERFF